jgi:glyoxylase-like metal-dependent hydrolase (beta-lactamase superfamily II)
MRRFTVFLLCLISTGLTLALAKAQTKATKGLDINVIDVEGGNSTLFVPPSGESVLIDTGNAGGATGRDSGRILDAIKDAGLQQIDHLITTHWHGDHFGGMAEVAARIPIKEYIDHGDLMETSPPTTTFLQSTYAPLYAKAKHTVVKPGDKIAVAGLDWRIVESAGKHINNSLPGAGKPNPYCAAFKPGDTDAT